MIDQVIDFKRLLQEMIGSGSLEFLDLVLLNHPADADDPDVIESGIAADPLTDFSAVDVRQHDVQHNDVRVIFLDHHSRIESVVRDSDFEPTVGIQGIRNEFDQLGVVIDDQCLALTAFESISRNAVFLHELEEHISRDAAESRAGDSKSLELTRIKAANDRLLTDLTDLGGFARGEHCFHEHNPFCGKAMSCNLQRSIVRQPAGRHP